MGSSILLPELSPYIKALTLVYPGRTSTRSLWMILTEYAKLIQSAHTTFIKRASGNTFHVMDSNRPVITPGDFVGTPSVGIPNPAFQDVQERFCGLLALRFSGIRDYQVCRAKSDLLRFLAHKKTS